MGKGAVVLVACVFGRRTFALIAVAFMSSLNVACQQAFAQTQSISAPCNQPAPDSVTFVDLPGHPFMPVATRDGCWIFVSLMQPKNELQAGVAVLRRTSGKISLVRVIPTQPGPAGMVLTHDGKVLIGAANDRVVFLDTARMISGEANAVLGYLHLPEYQAQIEETRVTTPGAIHVNVTSNDLLLFISEEWAQRIRVVDLEKARSSGFQTDSIIGTIPTGGFPIALTLSPDERYLYTTAEVAKEDWGWPIECKPEGQDPTKSKPKYPQGALVVVDAARAKSDSAHAVIAKVPAGCSAVRSAISPNGDRVYVTARNSNTLFAFDTKKLLNDSEHALIGKVPVGLSPVGLAVAEYGNKVFVANSNRFAGGSDKQNLSVIEAAKIGSGAAVVLGQLPAGGFPREIKVTTDGRTLLVTNFTSNTLELVDLARLSLH